jgi:hypothetical protein
MLKLKVHFFLFFVGKSTGNKDAIREKLSLLNPKLTIQHEHYAEEDMDKVHEPKLVPESFSEELQTKG